MVFVAQQPEDKTNPTPVRRGEQVERPTYTLVYDVKLRRPGCVLLQVAMGGTVPSLLFQELFPTESWLLGPTDDMQAYSTTEEQLYIVSAKTDLTGERR